MSKLVIDTGKNQTKRTRLSLAVTYALMGLSPLFVSSFAFAENDSAAKADEDIEVIEVSGIRGSIC